MNNRPLPNRAYHFALLFVFFILALSITLPAKSAMAQANSTRIFLPLIMHEEAPLPPLNGRVVMAVFEQLNGQLTADLYTMNPDGTDRVPITNAAEGTIHESPAWSPDGTRVAFAHYNRLGTERGIYLINADGSNRARLTNSDGQGYDYAPTWSPDGSKIAYYTTNETLPQIIVMNCDGSNAQQLTDFQSSENPQWSPDGSKIVFSSNQYELGNARKNIYVMNADGSNKTRLTFNTEGEENLPRWSPDGTRIVFSAVRGGESGTYIMNADGSNATRVPNMSGSTEITWSSDGTQLMFAAQPDSNINLDLYIINTDGSGLRRITETANLLEAYPHWRP